MFTIVEKELNLQFTLGHHQHCLLCQIPNHLGLRNFACKLTDPAVKWEQVRSILELVAEGPRNLKKLHFLLLPESGMPAANVDEALALIGRHFRPNTVTIFGVEHVSLAEYREFLERYRADNAEVLESVLTDLDAGNIHDVPVNLAVTAVKEADGRLRVFLMAKSHPFVREETLDPYHDLYRGKVFPLFRCLPVGFNFMALICLDYVYRDLYQSNISAIIDKANDLFFSHPSAPRPAGRSRMQPQTRAQGLSRRGPWFLRRIPGLYPRGARHGDGLLQRLRRNQRPRRRP